MWRSEEAETTRYKGQSSFLFQLRYNYGNRIDCSRGAVFTRWWGLGILSLARLARTGDERALAVVRDPNRGIFEVSIIMEVDTRINALWTVDVLRQFSARTVKENQIDLANKQQRIMKQLRCINDAARTILVATSAVTLPKSSRARKFASNPLSGSPELKSVHLRFSL
jgi:hypothetical protein